jgi:predicted amidohydrolase YtcJ
MSGTPLLDWAEAKRKGEEGMATAVDHAEAVSPGWKDRAAALVLIYATQVRRGESFLTEEAREWADIEAPPDNRTWGGVVTSLKRDGLLVRVGYGPARSSNLSPKCYWAAVR